MARLTSGDDAIVSGISGAIVMVAAAPVTKRWWQRRAQRRAQHAFDEGLPEVPGVREAVPPGRERTAVLERDMKLLRQGLRDLSATVETLVENQATMMHTLTELDRKVSGNGGHSYDSGDVLQRVAKKLGVWEVGSKEAENRREGDPK